MTTPSTSDALSTVLGRVALVGPAPALPGTTAAPVATVREEVAA